ncbi:uncharacterized protein DS421_6g173330 [Arachis hypogaea]|nr:uncharacterized protein DS421_6g173330 [Arachis hypogaea]
MLVRSVPLFCSAAGLVLTTSLSAVEVQSLGSPPVSIAKLFSTVAGAISILPSQTLFLPPSSALFYASLFLAKSSHHHGYPLLIVGRRCFSPPRPAPHRFWLSLLLCFPSVFPLLPLRSAPCPVIVSDIASPCRRRLSKIFLELLASQSPSSSSSSPLTPSLSVRAEFPSSLAVTSLPPSLPVSAATSIYGVADFLK